MLSSNIIERHQALNQLIQLDGLNLYFLMVASLMIACWRLKEWL